MMKEDEFHKLLAEYSEVAFKACIDKLKAENPEVAKTDKISNEQLGIICFALARSYACTMRTTGVDPGRAIEGAIANIGSAYELDIQAKAFRPGDIPGLGDEHEPVGFLHDKKNTIH